MNNDAVLQFPTASSTVLRLPRVKDRTGLSRSGIYDGVKKGTFPAPIKLGERAVGWLSIDIDKWLENRVAASRREAA